MDLTKLKVIELASVLAGPAVGMFFAELGATVIKVENKRTGGDVTRTWKNPNENKGALRSAYFSSVNWGKRHVLLDLKDAEDLAQLLEMVKDADIVIGNYNKGAAEKLKVDHASLLKVNPTLIYGNISGYGEDSDRPAYDAVLQAETGFMHMNGTPEVSPLKLPLAFMDVLAAHQLKEGLLVALAQREEDGRNKRVSVSLFDTGVASLYNQSANWLMSGFDPQPIGSLHPNIAPYGETMTCMDGKRIILAVGTDQQFAALCDRLDVSELTNDERFSSNQARVQHRTELAKALNNEFLKHAHQPLLSQLIMDRVPCGMINDIPAVFEQEAAQRLILEEDVDGEKTRRGRTTIFRISSL